MEPYGFDFLGCFFCQNVLVKKSQPELVIAC